MFDKTSLLKYRPALLIAQQPLGEPEPKIGPLELGLDRTFFWSAALDWQK